MLSTFSGIEIGKRSLVAHNLGLTTIGHNLSNAGSEGYSRQRVNMDAMQPIYMPGLNRAETAGQIGQGVNVQSIERIRDQILEGRIVAQGHEAGYWETRDQYLLMVDQIYQEPTDTSVRTLMDRFWDGWQELSMHPDEMASRQVVLQRGESLIEGIHQRYRGLREVRDMLEDEVQVTVTQVNDLTSEITELNDQIVRIQAQGDNPNDLLDRRDLLVERLSRLINITVDNRDPDEFTVHVGGRHLVQGNVAREFILEQRPENEGYSNVIWDNTEELVQLQGGKLGALLEMRDYDVREEIQSLDMMTLNFVDLVNEIHRQGYGLNGNTNTDFFQEYPAINNISGNYDRDGDGEYDASYIFRITGSNALEPQDQIGLQGTMTLSGPQGNIDIQYFPTDTVEDVIQRINTSTSEVVARLDSNNRLSLKASPAAVQENPDFVIRHIEDSGQFLAGYSGVLQESGEGGAYDWDQADAVLALRGGGLDYAVAPLTHPSGWVEVNRELTEDAGNIAAGLGQNGYAPEAGDGSAAITIAALRNREVMVGQLGTFDDYFANAVAEIGAKGEEAEIALETQNRIMEDLTAMRDSISGVNIDEELSLMIRFQHGYTAAARFINTVNQMLDTIINRLGV
ncbi:MAG: flagellar hook-associated protein FlgK [Spirochaetia bacterium]